MIWLIFGPSGVGKSSFGQWLANERNWLHLEIDLFQNDGIDHHCLRCEWDAFLTDRPDVRPFRRAIDKRMNDNGSANCVLTFPGCIVLEQHHVRAAESVEICSVNLFGSEEACLKHFLERESRSGHNLTASHWSEYKANVFETLRKPINARNTVDVFTRAAEHKPRAEVFDAVLKICSMRPDAVPPMTDSAH